MIQSGDILLWKVGPGSPWLARLISWGERIAHQYTPDKKSYFHVAFVASDPTQMYESKPPKIRKSVIPVPLESDIEVYRLKQGITVAQLAQLYAYADSQIGKWYNLIGVVSFGYIQFGDFPYCSQFAWEAYTHCGILLWPWEELESPNDIASSSLLERVT